MAQMIGVTEEALREKLAELMESPKLGEAIAQANAAMAAQAATVGEEVRFDPAAPVAEPAVDDPYVGAGGFTEPVGESATEARNWFRSTEGTAVEHVDGEPSGIDHPENAAILAADAINPQHYQGFSNGAQVIDITENLNFNRGNCVKYAARAGAKNPDTLLEDLKKARWYLDREIARVERETAA